MIKAVKTIYVGEADPLTGRVIGLAIEVHRALVPGLLESAYEEGLCFELRQNGISHRRQAPLPIVYKGVRLECAYKMDIVVDEALVVEIKAVERLMAVHDAQVLSDLRLSGLHKGLLINFHAMPLREGLRRLVL